MKKSQELFPTLARTYSTITIQLFETYRATPSDNPAPTESLGASAYYKTELQETAPPNPLDSAAEFDETDYASKEYYDDLPSRKPNSIFPASSDDGSQSDPATLYDFNERFQLLTEQLHKLKLLSYVFAF